MQKLFQICQRFLLLIGGAARLSYIEISVIFNLWIQGGLLTLSSVVPISVLLYTGNYNEHPFLMIILSLYTLLYIVLFILMLVHYKLPFDRAYYLCVDDLRTIAKKWHITYQVVNILIFIVAFLVLLCANVFIPFLVK
jgi:hypothetical protein